MLGRLLNTAASSLNPASYTSRNAAQLESVTEEEHTSGLLFPDASLLRRSNTHAYPLQTSTVSPSASAARSFDDRGGVELDASKDFRVVIAQNAIGDRDEPCVLLDTLNQGERQRPRELGLDGRQNPTRRNHSRSSSLAKSIKRPSTISAQSSFQDVSHTSEPSNFRKVDIPDTSPFFRARYRSSTFSPIAGDNDYHHSRTAVGSNELGLLNCIFGSSAFSYRGSSTKMHVLPIEAEPYEVDNFAPTTMRHRAPLSRAYTAGPHSSSSSLSQERMNSSTDARSSTAGKVTVLVTRMFSVNLPEGRRSSTDAVYDPASPYTGSFRDTDISATGPGKRKKIKEKKTPMYAVAITVNLPLVSRVSGRPSSQWSDSLQPAGHVSASLDSDHKWPSFFMDDNPASLSTASNLDERIDMLVDHWDVITRTLSHLEKLASKEILHLLQKVDSYSAQQPKPAKPPNMQRTNQTIVQLSANVLSGNSVLKAEAAHAINRISTAIRIPRVITGQSRWGVWREEARWIARYLSDKEHNFFFLVLITAFLGNHTEWLSSLSPDWYRRRYYLQQKAQQDAEPTIPSRTIIISSDKMTARRLIFVLSAFLPAQQRSDMMSSPLRPGTAASLRPISQSPPGAPFLRQESLRRTINRRARARHLGGDGDDSHKRSTSASSNETPTPPLDEMDFVKSIDASKARRDSDVRSIRTASLPIPSNDVTSRKSATVATATAAPSTATPVPHFASQGRQRDRSRGTNPSLESSESAASANLLQNLRRSESSNLTAESNGRPGHTRWGSLLSGFWGSREATTGEASKDQAQRRMSVASSTLPRSENIDTVHDKLDNMTTRPGNELVGNVVSIGNVSIPAFSTTQLPTSEPEGAFNPKPTVETQVPSSPVKLAVGFDDGVIDVEVPLPGFMSLSSSGDSTLASPRKTRTSMTSLDGVPSVQSMTSGLFGKDYDRPNVNVAGWLKRYHEDFILQAVHPYSELEAEIRRSMSAEPTPLQASPSSLSDFSPNSEKWVDVCTTLIADTRTFTMKRLRLRRRVSINAAGAAGTPPANSSPASPFDVTASMQFPPSANSTAPAPVDTEEIFIEEPVMDLDGTLVDAVERVLARSGQTSMVHSRAPSPNRSRRDKSTSNQGPDKHTTEDVPSIEVPRNECKKMVLGALEEVVRSVAAERCQDEVRAGLGVITGHTGRGRWGPNPATGNTLREGIRRWLLDIEEAC
ncbi:hypothetical protein AJ80_03864 [Polytolypa hystricis UAMH7299]|uniref:Folliculin-interacting protein N-terminal domain-containing protein n=1 Tax=Polytolypa hystricis (strain UAMH7299) TaxID=1447883 RepID=A0A2B7YEM4_POLH7|nr:hypothetical protein AJ80_03864 [Polytolypa hystricis UAMH7299]